MVQLAPRAAASDGDSLPESLQQLRGIAEYPEPGETAYILRPDATGGLTPTPVEVDEETRYQFPFRRPTGARAAQLGPVLKRSVNTTKKEVSPGKTVLRDTFEHFEALAQQGLPVSPVYARALQALGASLDERVDRVSKAMADIPGNKTVYISLGDPPGNDPAYAKHLLEVIRVELYGIGDEAPEKPCPLCACVARLGARALSMAKINFLNMDNHGFFPAFDKDRAHQRFALCAACTNAIASTYIHLKDELKVNIAGSPALLLPELHGADSEGKSPRRAWDVLQAAKAARNTSEAEHHLLDTLAREGALASFHILWASTGDSLDDVTGLVTDVPCTRLAALSKVNAEANQWQGGMLPRYRVKNFDLSLTLLGDVLRHPGGDRVKRRNGKHLDALRRQVARAVYLGTPFDEKVLLSEWRDIVADHLVDPTVDDRNLAFNLIHEFEPNPGKKAFLNAASQARHFALLLRYLRHLEVLPPMSSEGLYSPRAERLKKLLAPPSGIADDAQMFALFLGVLFGRLVAIQGSKGFNVRANTLTWLRRATLTGNDLPGLYVKVREKLLEYEAERDSAVREVIADLSELGRRLGTTIPLDADRTMYFLFLGQALAGEVFPKKSDDSKETP